MRDGNEDQIARVHFQRLSGDASAAGHNLDAIQDLADRMRFRIRGSSRSLMFAAAQTGPRRRRTFPAPMSQVARISLQSETDFSREPDSSPRATKCEVTCVKCNVRESCLSGGVPAEDLERVENIVVARRRIRRGERLFNAGDTFRCVYAIRTGFFKTLLGDSEGRDQITGFFMGGELLGMDGLGSGRYKDSAIALEDSDVCVMPYSLIDEIASNVPSLQHHLHSVLAREIVRGQGIMMLLGTMSAKERLAAFLINLSKRFLRRGYSGSHFILRMTRDEIGSYLGLKLETVSRLFSAYHKEGLLDVQQRQISILDMKGLERLLTHRN
jgi:CRP/FNR family transcriptional regulator, anaerobic regulatory protein